MSLPLVPAGLDYPESSTEQFLGNVATVGLSEGSRGENMGRFLDLNPPG